jgi:hypothetical protein
VIASNGRIHEEMIETLAPGGPAGIVLS